MIFKRVSPVFVLMAGAFCIATAPISVKSISLDPTVVAFHRCFFSFLLMFAYYVFFCRRKLRQSFQILKSQKIVLGLIALAGIFFFFDLLVWHKSIQYVGAGFATILGNTQVFHIALISVFFDKTRLKPSFFLSLLLAFCGVFFMFYEKPHWAHQESYFLGVIYGVLTGVFYAGYIKLLQLIQAKEERLGVFFIMFLVMLVSSFFLFVYSVFFESFRFPAATSDWAWTVLLVLVAQLLGWVLIASSISKIPLHLASLVLLLQPILATLFGAWYFAESLNILQILGCSLALLGIYAGQQSTQTKSK